MPKLLFFFFLTSRLAFGAEIPLEHFTKHGDYLDLKISPDGKHFSARVRYDGEVPLIFIERASGKMVGGVRPGERNEIHTVNWINNERVIFEKAEKQFYLDAPIPTGELFSVDISGKKRKLLFGYRAGDKNSRSRISTKENIRASQELVSTLPENSENILIIEHPWTKEGNYYWDKRNKRPNLSLLNFTTGKRRKLEVLPFEGASVLATNTGDVLFASWRDKKNVMRAAYRKTVKSLWVELDENTLEGSEINPVALSSDASKAYFIVNQGELGVRNMLELNLITGERDFVFAFLESNLGGWEVELDTGIPVVGITHSNKTEYHYSARTSKTSELHKKLKKAFKGQAISITSSTKDGSLLLLRISSDVNPGEYYVFDVVNNKAEFVWANRSWIDPRDLRHAEPISIVARDGLKLSGFLTMPEKPDDDKPPMVVMIHGGPHGSRDYWYYDSEVQLLASRGYAVLQINFRGSGGFGHRFEELGYKQWGGKMIDDIVDATNWAASEGSIDKNRICAYGASYGGYAAMMVAAQAPELYRCTIGYVGVYSLNYMFTKGDIIDSWGGLAYLEKVLGDENDLLDKYSPVNRVGDIQASVMLIHGDNDQRVPVAHYNAMRKALKQSGNPAEEMIFDLSGHSVWHDKSRGKLYTGMLKFLKQNIGQKESTMSVN